MSEQYSLDEIVKKIESQIGLSREEIYAKINEIVSEYTGSITELGAAYLLANNLNIELSEKKEVVMPPKVFLGDIVPDMNNITVEGRVIRIYDRVRFSRKDGGEGTFISCMLQDNTGNARIVFWDHAAEHFEQSRCKIGDSIRIIGAYTKAGKHTLVEIHAGNRSHIQFRPSDLTDEVLPPYKLETKKIVNINETDYDITIIAQVTRKDEIISFERSDGSKGMLQKISVADETGEVQIIFWNEKTKLLEHINEGDLIEIVGLNAKTSMHGYIELHSTNFTKIEQTLDKKPIQIKRGYIKFVDETITETSISELQPNQTISIKGLIASINPFKEFTRTDGTIGKVKDFWIVDKSGAVRVVLWDDKVEMVTDAHIGQLVVIKNAFVKKGKYGDFEINCGKQAHIEIESISSNRLSEYLPDSKLISEISEQDKFVTVKGEIINLFPVRSIVTKEDETVELRSFKIQDNTGSISISCWRDNIRKISNFQEGDRIIIINAMVKHNKNYGTSLNVVSKTIIFAVPPNETGEIADFFSANEVLTKEQHRKSVVPIEELKVGEEAVIEGTVIKIIETTYLSYRCSLCNKKLEKTEQGFYCAEHGDIEKPNYKLFIPLVLNDGTASITVLFTGTLAEKLLKITSVQAAELINQQGSELALYARLIALDYEHKDLRILGKVSFNQRFNKKELLAKEVNEVNYYQAINAAL